MPIIIQRILNMATSRLLPSTRVYTWLADPAELRCDFLYCVHPHISISYKNHSQQPIVSNLGFDGACWARILKKVRRSRTYDLPIGWWYWRVFEARSQKKRRLSCCVKICVPECWLDVIIKRRNRSPSIALDIIYATVIQSWILTRWLLWISLFYCEPICIDRTSAPLRCGCSLRVPRTIPINFRIIITVSLVLLGCILPLPLLGCILPLASDKLLLLEPTLKYKSQLLHLLDQLINTLPDRKNRILILLVVALALITIILILLFL